MTNETTLDELDTLAVDLFPGLVVRKDLLRRMRSRSACRRSSSSSCSASTAPRPTTRRSSEGLEFVRRDLSEKYVKPDEREVVKAPIKQQATYEIIDKVSASAWSRRRQVLGALANLNRTTSTSTRAEIREHDRLLMGGIWAEITLRYDDSFKFKGQNRPFVIDKHPADPALEPRRRELHRGRKRTFTRDEWIDLLHALAGLGAEPSRTSRTRRKLLYLARLVPLVEQNYNLVELGPRGTGKSFVYQQISPYCHLVSGGQTTVAQMFVNLATGQRGLSRCGTSSPSTRRPGSASRTRTASTS